MPFVYSFSGIFDSPNITYHVLESSPIQISEPASIDLFGPRIDHVIEKLPVGPDYYDPTSPAHYAAKPLKRQPYILDQ